MFSSIKDLFHDLTGFSPRDFQQETITRILDRQDTLLGAPTGSGKTETAIAPFIFAKTLNLDFPNKLIYVVPLRTLANSLRDRAKVLVDRWSHSLPRPLVVTLQTGENPEDPRFEGDIVFCTIDQLLSSFLNIPYSVGRGSGNVNAGVVFASYLVFDELHLLDPQRSFATVLKLLQQVRGISPFLLMTATLTNELASGIFEDASNFIRVADTDLAQIEGTRHRTFHIQSHPLTAQAIWNDIEEHHRQRVIVICNTVSQAQGLYRDLDELNQDEQLKVTLLHSRFLPEHRAFKERYLEQTFAQNSVDSEQCNVLIATQVIEVGLNITCEVMHTQLCPMNSLLQRAGRCARFDNEQGQVFIYRDIEVDEDNFFQAIADSEEAESEPVKIRKFLPYNDQICELTWKVLEDYTQLDSVNNPVTFRIEENWINQVHREEDNLQAQRRDNNQAEFDRQFNQAIFQGDRSVADTLIRFVDSRCVFVWEETSFIDFEEQPVDPKKLIAFSLPTPTLCGIFRKYQERGYKTDWLFKRIENPKGKAESYSQPVTVPILSNSDLVNSFKILVNPKYLEYDEHIGLRIGIDIVGNNFISPERSQKQLPSEYQYNMDNYVGHLVLMWKSWRENFTTRALINGELTELEYIGVKNELLSAGGRLIKTNIFPQASLGEVEGLFEYLVLLAIFTHDLGKLQIKWQDAMRGWQEIAYRNFRGRNPNQQLIAHTDYNPEDKQQRQALKSYEKKHKRPPHAVESAFLAREILIQCLFPLLQNHFHASREQMVYIAHTIIMATGRHHSAWTNGWKIEDVAKKSKIDLHPDAQKAIAQSWRSLVRFFPNSLPLPPAPNLSRSSYDAAEFDLNQFSSSQIVYLQLYSLVVRALRLCDMRSVQLS